MTTAKFKRRRIPRFATEDHRERYEARLRRVNRDLRSANRLFRAARETFADPLLGDGADLHKHHRERAEELSSEIETKSKLGDDEGLEKMREVRDRHRSKARRLRKAWRRLGRHYPSGALLDNLVDRLKSDRRRLKLYLETSTD